MRRVIVFVVVLLGRGVAISQTLGDNIINPGIGIQQNQKIQQQQENTQGADLKGESVHTEPPQQTQPNEHKCIQIEHITLRLNGLKELYENKKLLKEYEKTCLSMDDLKALTKKLQNNYTDAGYFQVQVVIKEQDISTGTLELYLLPARLDAIKLKPDEPMKYRFNNMIRSSFPIGRGDVLEFADMETGIDSLNALESIDAKLMVAPGEKEGQTILYLDIKESDRMRGFVGVNNQGQAFLGEYKLAPSLQVDNLLQMGDSWTASYFGNTSTDALAISTRIPLKPKWTFSGSYMYSDFLAGLATSSSSVITDLYGEYKSLDLSLTRQLYRKNAVQIYASAGASVKRSSRELDGFPLADQNESVLTANLYGLINQKNWQANLGAAISGGIPVLEATTLPKDGRFDVPDGRFLKVEGFGNLYKRLKYGLFHTSLTGQYIPRASYGLEHLVLGGMYSVRGYPESVASGEQGFLNRNELTANLPLPESNKLLKAIKESLHPLVFFDQGLARKAYSTANRTEYLASLGTGFRLNYKLLDLELIYGLPLLKPNDSQDFTSGGRVHFSIRLKGF